MDASTETRVSDLEAEMFRHRGQLSAQRAQQEHVTEAIGDLSQQVRGVAFDVRQLNRRVVRTDLMVRAIAAHLGIPVASEEEIDAALNEG